LQQLSQKDAIECAIQGSDPISVLESNLLSRYRELYRSHRPRREGLLSVEGSCLFLENDYEGAEVVLTKALEHCNDVFGPWHPETRGCLMALVGLYETWEELEKAQEYRKHLVKIETGRK